MKRKSLSQQSLSNKIEVQIDKEIKEIDDQVKFDSPLDLVSTPIGKVDKKVRFSGVLQIDSPSQKNNHVKMSK